MYTPRSLSQLALWVAALLASHAAAWLRRLRRRAVQPSPALAPAWLASDGPVLVTGASTGLGFALASQLAAAGCPLVVVTSRCGGRAAAAAAALRLSAASTSCTVVGLALQQSTAAGCDAFAERLAGVLRGRQLNGAVLCAGCFPCGSDSDDGGKGDCPWRPGTSPWRHAAVRANGLGPARVLRRLWARRSDRGGGDDASPLPSSSSALRQPLLRPGAPAVLVGSFTHWAVPARWLQAMAHDGAQPAAFSAAAAAGCSGRRARSHPQPPPPPPLRSPAAAYALSKALGVALALAAAGAEAEARGAPAASGAASGGGGGGPTTAAVGVADPGLVWDTALTRGWPPGLRASLRAAGPLLAAPPLRLAHSCRPASSAAAAAAAAAWTGGGDCGDARALGAAGCVWAALRATASAAGEGREGGLGGGGGRGVCHFGPGGAPLPLSRPVGGDAALRLRLAAAAAAWGE